MIPKKAIKKFTKPSHRDIAVSTLISYGIFPQTNEGIEKAKKLIAGQEEWLAPSNLPNYYDGIESDLMTGKETAGIINIRGLLKEFYGLTTKTADVETAEDTRVSVDDSVDVIVDEENNPEEKEVEAQAQAATEFITETENAVEKQIDESILDDFPESLRASLAKVISKKTGVQLEPSETKVSTSITNAKIFKFLTNNLIKIQGQLAGIDKSIQDQTKLMQANLQITASIYDSLDAQNSILSEKLGAILEIFNKQNELARKLAEDEEDRIAEARLEDQRDAAGTETAMSTLGKRGAKSGNSLMRRLARFFGKRLASKLFKLLPFALKRKAVKLRQLTRLPKKLKEKAAAKLIQRIAPRAAAKTTQAVASRAIGTGVVKGFEHIALPGVTRAAQQVDKPAATALEKGGGGILQRALKSPVIQRALLRVLGKEGAQKLTLKLAAKLIPGISTAYGVGEGIARIAMGDVKGGFLSFGSAIPVAGYGFAAVDILRDINVDAYTKHIESNLPAPSDANIAAFFADALGVTQDQYEQGGVTRPGIAMLHGTELIRKNINNSAGSDNSANIVGGSILAATAAYIDKLGPAGASIVPVFKQAAVPLAEQFDVPKTVVQTNVGGSFPSLESTMKKAREKRKRTPEEQLSAMEKELLDTQDPGSFADKLLKMLDPEGKFQEILRNLNRPRPTGPGGEVSAEPFVLLGGSQDPKQPGIDFTLKGTQNRAVLAGNVIEIGHQYNSNATGGDGRQGAGYGNYIVIRSTNPVDGSQVDMLYAHFPKGEIKVREGEQVSVGQDLGRMATEAEYANPQTRREVGSGTGPHTSLDFFKPGTQQAHSKARELGDYILKELRKGPEGAIEKERQQAYQQQQAQRSLETPTGVTTNEISNLTDTRDPAKLILGAGHQGPGGQGTAFGGVAEHQATAHMLRAIQSLVKQDPDLADKIGFESFTNNNFARDNAAKNTNKGKQFIELHFDQYGGGGRSGLIPSRNARQGVTGNAGTSSFDVALSKHFGNYGANFKKGDLGIPDTGGSILEFGAIDSNQALLKEIKSGTIGPETIKLAQYTYQALREGAKNEGWIDGSSSRNNITPPAQRQPAQSKYYLRQGGDKKADTQIVMIPASSAAGKAIEKNATVEGQRFVYDANYNVFKTQNEISSVERATLLRRLGLN